MIVLNALSRQRALCHASKATLRSLHTTIPTARGSPFQNLRPPCLPSRSPRPTILRRLASTTTNPATPSTASSNASTALYPESVNIYRAGTFATVFVGLFRVCTILVWAIGGLLYPVAIFNDADFSNLWIPVAMVGSGVPFVAMVVASGPMVHAVRVMLPPAARRGKAELKNFSKQTPPNTVLNLQYMNWLPWPVKRSVHFSRLRRLKPSWRTVSNLEHVPRNVEKLGKHPFWGEIGRSWLGKFYVNRRQGNDRAAVPGVWDGLWEQIPFRGDKQDPEVRGKRAKKRVEGPVVMRGRAGGNRERPAVPMARR